MIARFPALPPLQNGGERPKPTVLLLGGRNGGTWQQRASLLLSRKLGPHAAVICTDSVEVPFEEFRHLLEMVDAVVVWQGLEADCLYLEEWVYFGYAVGKDAPLWVGRDPATPHPMAVVLSVKKPMFNDLDQLVEAVALACKQRR